MKPIWWREDYDAIRDRAGSLELPGWSHIQLGGADRAGLLNSLGTNRLDDLQSGQGRETFFTDTKGHVLAHGLILADEDSTSFLTAAPRAESIASHFAKYVIREDVQVADRSLQSAVWYLGGRQAGIALENLGIPVPQGLGEHANAMLEKASMKVCRVDMAGPTGFLLVATREQARLVARLIQREVKTCVRAAFESARIQWGWPLDGIDVSSDNFPQEIGRDDQAISFTKGCYLGQETVARLESLGHVNRRLVVVRFPTGEPVASASLTVQGKPVGATTSMGYWPELACPVGLAYVRRQWAEPGTLLESSLGPAETVPAAWQTEVDGSSSSSR